MFLTNLFFKKKCQHEHITPDMESGYCPDCGKLIHNEWYITRCSCCGVKTKAILKNGEIVPQNHYCVNCGGQEYVVEKVPKINLIDINFAVLIKREEKSSIYKTSTSRCWQERINELPKLSVQYL